MWRRPSSNFKLHSRIPLPDGLAEDLVERRLVDVEAVDVVGSGEGGVEHAARRGAGVEAQRGLARRAPQEAHTRPVGDERVEPQPGGFYAGWITSRVVGPFKGAPGTWGW